MTEQFRDIAKSLRSQGYDVAANETYMLEGSLRDRGLIPPTLELDSASFREYIRRHKDPVTLRQLSLAIVNGHLGSEVTEEVLLGKTRVKEVAQTRHLVAYLMWDVGRLSLSTIARSLGRKDHTTILNSIDRVQKWGEEPAVKASIDGLSLRLRQTISLTP